MVELNSMISPSFGSGQGATSSSPVGITPIFGRLTTSTRATPAASSAPWAAGVISV